MAGNSEIQVPDSTASCLNTSKSFKVVIIGDGGTGKSSYVTRLNSGNFRKEYIATVGVEKHSILVETSHGEFKISIWDTAGQEKLGPLRDGYYEDADAAVIFFDVTSRITYKNIPGWHKDITRVCGDVPIVLCANKIDISQRKVKSKSITYHNKHKMECFEISVLNRIALKRPLQYLLQQLVKEPELTISASLEESLFGNMTNIDISSNECS